MNKNTVEYVTTLEIMLASLTEGLDERDLYALVPGIDYDTCKKIVEMRKQVIASRGVKN